MDEKKATYITRCTMARDFLKLSQKLGVIPPEDIIAVTEAPHGTYTIVYKSLKEWWEK